MQAGGIQKRKVRHRSPTKDQATFGDRLYPGYDVDEQATTDSVSSLLTGENSDKYTLAICSGNNSFFVGRLYRYCNYRQRDGNIFDDAGGDKQTNNI
ncbi:MAG: hypothetical protein DRR11_10705 [Gammaproteobacteria bacterium]|nr:MAG: hypothetical protein DRR11_10705 [Gammaproteobacteria bacterium]